MSKHLTRFSIKRTDGRSDAQVIIDLVGDATPGDLFTFEQIMAALQQGVERTINQDDVRGAVSRSEHRLLSEKSRTLMNVRGLGYKLAAAGEHSLLARNRKARSDKLLKKGLHTLQNVRWDEMGTEERAAHEGSLMVMSSLVMATQAIHERQDHLEKRIDSLLK